MQDTPTYRAEVVKEMAGCFVRLGEKATEVLRRLKERPGFLKLPCAGAAPTQCLKPSGRALSGRAQWPSPCSPPPDPRPGLNEMLTFL
jgi:hypothetical protein